MYPPLTLTSKQNVDNLPHSSYLRYGVEMEEMNYLIRINKYLRDKGFASRREADELVAQGKVLINGVLAETGMLVKEGDEVTVNRTEKETARKYIAYYKPRGLATQDHEGKRSVVTDWQGRGIFPIGRLDKASEGLLILTNDGRLTTRLQTADARYEKEYVVTVRESLGSDVPDIFKKGMKTDALGQLLPAEAEIVDAHTIKIILHEGKHHQIRIMLGELGYTITSLKRVRIGHLTAKGLTPGQVRPLTEDEVAQFFA